MIFCNTYFVSYRYIYDLPKACRLISFCCESSQNSTHIFQISNKLHCDILLHNITLRTITYMTSQKHWLPKQIKQWKMRLYHVLYICCDGDHDSDLIFLASVTFRIYTTVTNQCQWLSCTWTWHIQYCDCWSHFETRPSRILSIPCKV